MEYKQTIHGVEITIKIIDTEMFKDFVLLLKELHRNNPELNIDNKVKQIALKHHFDSEYLTEEQNNELAKICKDVISDN